MSKPLHEYTDAELKAEIAQSAERTTYFYEDYRKELERRAAESQAKSSRILSIASIAIAVAAVIIAAVRG